MMMALAGAHDLPVRARARRRDAAGRATARTRARCRRIGARFAHGEITLEEAAELGCRACASPGGGCQFLGTAATVAGRRARRSGWRCRTRRSRPRASRSGSTWPGARRAALAGAAGPQADDARHPHRRGDPQRDGRPRGVRRLDEPAAAHPGHRARGRPARARRSTTGRDVNRRVPRLVDALPNGPRPSDGAACSWPAACPR